MRWTCGVVGVVVAAAAVDRRPRVNERSRRRRRRRFVCPLVGIVVGSVVVVVVVVHVEEFSSGPVGTCGGRRLFLVQRIEHRVQIGQPAVAAAAQQRRVLRPLVRLVVHVLVHRRAVLGCDRLLLVAVL